MRELMLTQLLPGPVPEEASVGDVCFLQAYMQNLSLLELGKGCPMAVRNLRRVTGNAM